MTDAIPAARAAARLWPLQHDCNAFYGNPGDTPAAWAAWEAANLVTVTPPWAISFFDGKKATPIKGIRIHRKCAASLAIVLGAIWDKVGRGQAAIAALRYDHYSGSYNQRPMRGMSARSMHGFGAAIDWDAEQNAQHSEKHLLKADSLLVVKFKEQGWIWGGDWAAGSIDAMHVQAARVHP